MHYVCVCVCVCVTSKQQGLAIRVVLHGEPLVQYALCGQFLEQDRHVPYVSIFADGIPVMCTDVRVSVQMQGKFEGHEYDSGLLTTSVHAFTYTYTYTHTYQVYKPSSFFIL
jgi:hypothetical protein